MSNPIDIQIRDALVTKMLADMSQANGYRYDVGIVNEFDVGGSTYPRHEVVISEDLDHDIEDGTSKLMYQEFDMSITSYWMNEDEIDGMDQLSEAEKMSEDIKRLVGGVSDIVDSCEIFYMEHEPVWSNDNTFPIATKTTLKCRYWQIRTEPETTG